MRGVNLAIIVGNLGNDPEVKYMPDGTAVCSLSVATSDQWKDKQTGEPKERTDWHRVKVIGKAAEACGEYLQKGSKVYVQGSTRHEKYTDRAGVEKYVTYIRVDMNGTVQFLDRAGGDRSEREPTSAPARSAPQRRAPAEDMDPFRDDDIPF